jgi:hypothetical protein
MGAAFHQLPRGAVVTWRDSLLLAWRHPPQAIAQHVKQAASGAEVSLQDSPSAR